MLTVEPAVGRAVWSAEELAEDASWRVAPGGGVATRVAAALQKGRGLALVREDTVTDFNAGLSSFVDLCRAIGAPRRQDGGALYGHVRPASDATAIDGYASAATSTSSASLHSEHARSADPPRLVAFLCVRPSAHGGETILASGGRAHNELLQGEGERLARLYQPVAFARHPRAKEPGVDRAPVFSVDHDEVRVRYPRYWIHRVLAATNAEPAMVGAVDAWELVLESPVVRYSMSLRSGDILVLRNDLVLHGRESFGIPRGEDDTRHLIRILMD